MFRMHRCSPTFLKLTTICDVSHVISFTRPSSPLFFRGAGPGEEGLGTRLAKCTASIEQLVARVHKGQPFHTSSAWSLPSTKNICAGLVYAFAVFSGLTLHCLLWPHDFCGVLMQQNVTCGWYTVPGRDHTILWSGAYRQKRGHGTQHMPVGNQLAM